MHRPRIAEKIGSLLSESRRTENLDTGAAVELLSQAREQIMTAVGVVGLRKDEYEMVAQKVCSTHQDDSGIYIILGVRSGYVGWEWVTWAYRPAENMCFWGHYGEALTRAEALKEGMADFAKRGIETP